MAEEKIELLDDFLVDMDIETITLDNVNNKDFIDIEESEETVELSEETKELEELSKKQGIEIENINVPPVAGNGEVTINAENVNIYQNTAGTTEVHSATSIAGVGEKEKISISMPEKLEINKAPVEIKEAKINVNKSEILSDKMEIKSEEKPIDIYEPTPSEEEVITISEADLDNIPKDNDLVELDELGKQTEMESMNISEGILDEINSPEMEMEFEEKEELASIDELEKIEEPTPQEEEEVIEENSELIPSEAEEKKEEEDIIISIDGSELDNLIYGEEGLLKLTEKESTPLQAEPKIEEEISETHVEKIIQEEATPEISLEETMTEEFISEAPSEEITSEEAISEKPREEETSLEQETGEVTGLENIEEIKFEEIQLEEIELPEEPIKEPEVSNIPVIEKEEIETEIVPARAEEKIEEKTEELVAPSELSFEETQQPVEETKPAEEEFTFDLSVIPDVAEVEEDEPIALSLEELNNIEVSEETFEYKPEAIPEIPLVEEENVEVPIEEFSQPEEDFVKEPASLEVYGVKETTQLPEELEVTNVEDLLKEPSIQTFSETGEVSIEKKIEALSSETKEELKTVLKYLDNLLENLPEDKIKEFAKSEYYDLYIKILDKLGI